MLALFERVRDIFGSTTRRVSELLLEVLDRHFAIRRVNRLRTAGYVKQNGFFILDEPLVTDPNSREYWAD